MSNDLISREALKEHTIWTKVSNGVELIDIEVVPLDAINNAPTVKAFTEEDMAGAYNEGYACGGRESKRPQGECKACDYYKFVQSVINGIVELISKNGITSIDELLEALKKGAKNDK